MKYMFNKDRACSGGLKIPFRRIARLLGKYGQGCVHIVIDKPWGLDVINPNYTISNLTLVSSLAALTRSSVRSA